jgi:hypothetical protein
MEPDERRIPPMTMLGPEKTGVFDMLRILRGLARYEDSKLCFSL